MKAAINETGILTITSDTPLECYALRMWLNENLHDKQLNTVPTDKMLFVYAVPTDGSPNG